MPEVKKIDNLAKGYIRIWMGCLIVLIRAAYDILPCSQNITQGCGVVSCSLCITSKASLQKYCVKVQGGSDPKALQVAPRTGAILPGRVLIKMQGTAANCIQETAWLFLATFLKPGKHAEHPHHPQTR